MMAVSTCSIAWRRLAPNLSLLRPRRHSLRSLEIIAKLAAGGTCAAVCGVYGVRASCVAADSDRPPPPSRIPRFELVDIVDHPSLVDQAAELLAMQWPKRGAGYRRQSLLSHCSSARLAHRGALPTVLLLIDRESSNAVIAHCKVQVFPQAGDEQKRMAILVSCVVHTRYRKRGVGRLLISHAERTAAANGHDRLYLWTLPADNVTEFYAACGFEECQRPSYSPAHGRSLRTRQRNYPPAPPGAIWMRKTLVESS